MIVVFTHGDKLAEQKSIQEYLTEGHPKLKEVVSRCGNRYYVFNNKDKNRVQVVQLIKKIDEMVAANEGSHYTDEMFEKAREILHHEREKTPEKLFSHREFMEELRQKTLQFQQKLAFLED